MSHPLAVKIVSFSKESTRPLEFLETEVKQEIDPKDRYVVISLLINHKDLVKLVLTLCSLSFFMDNILRPLTCKLWKRFKFLWILLQFLTLYTCKVCINIHFQFKLPATCNHIRIHRSSNIRECTKYSSIFNLLHRYGLKQLRNRILLSYSDSVEVKIYDSFVYAEYSLCMCWR